MSGTGLSANPKEYRDRLADQPDEQIDRWVSELMRDVVKRRGIVKVVDDFRSAARLSARLNSNVRSLSAAGRRGRSGGTPAAGSSSRRSACGPSCPGSGRSSPTAATG